MEDTSRIGPAPSTRLSDKVALVIGAGSIGPGWGNGKATSVALARSGAAVACVDLDRAAAEETAAIVVSEGGRAIAVQADATDSASVQAAVDACLDAFGTIDILDNNVGIAESAGLLEMSEESWDRVMTVNVKSAFVSMRAVIPHMIERGGGAIVNIASIAGIRHLGLPYASYYASKAALLHLSRTTAIEFADRGIRINSVLPGAMNTPLVAAVAEQFYGDVELDALWTRRAAQVPIGLGGEGWDVASAVVFLASDEARYITGADLVVDGGLSLKPFS
jgi:NAD(P)-dependent dehydrogenase (short-subunit alcohol dehydrogenase family)